MSDESQYQKVVFYLDTETGDFIDEDYEPLGLHEANWNEIVSTTIVDFRKSLASALLSK